jgi:putative phosphoesterase
MKIAIIADTHGNLANIKKIIDWLKKEKITFIIHCGDVNGPSTLKDGFSEFSGEMLLVLGNADFGWKEDYDILPNAKVFEKYGEIVLDGKKIAFAHYLEPARDLAKSGKYNLVFYGHTHRPWEKKIGECRLVNPGEAAGQYQKPTFAVYDTQTNNLELKILELLK